MKKIVSLALAMMLVLTMLAGCNSTPAGSDKTPLTDTLDVVIENIYANKAVEFMVGTMPVDLTDLDALPYFTGLSSAEGVKEAAVSEAMVGSIAYSMVLVRLEEGADAQGIAQQMKDGIDTRKWICVEADDLKVAGYCDVIMLIMVSSEHAASVTAQNMVDAFQTVCGAELDFVI